MSVDSDWEEPVLESNEDDQPVVHQLSFMEILIIEVRRLWTYKNYLKKNNEIRC